MAARPRKKRKCSSTQTIKMSLRRGLKDENKDKIREIITTRVLEMTKCSKLAALNVHCHFNHLLRTKSDVEIHTYFDRVIDRNFFDDFYRGVTLAGHNELDIENSGYILYLPISRMCQTYGVRAPNIEGFGNIVNFASQMFSTNFKNNIWMHAKTRIKRICYAHSRDKQAVNATMHYLFFKKSRKRPNENILMEKDTSKMEKDTSKVWMGPNGSCMFHCLCTYNGKLQKIQFTTEN